MFCKSLRRAWLWPKTWNISYIHGVKHSYREVNVVFEGQQIVSILHKCSSILQHLAPQKKHTFPSERKQIWDQTKHPSFSSLLFTKTFHFKFMLGALTLFLNYMHALLNIVVHTLMGGGGARTKGIHISDYKWGAFLYLCALQDFSSLCLILVFSQSHFPFTSSWSRVRPKPKSVHCCCT